MATLYEAWITNPYGTRLAVMPDYESLDYIRTVNQLGTLKGVVPYAPYKDLLVAENRIEIWRSVNGGPYNLDLQTSWTIREVSAVLSDQGTMTLEFVAFDGYYLLGRRDVAYNSTTAQASKTGALDDMMKAIINENFGTLAITSRNLSAWLTIQANLTKAPSGSKSFARRNVLAVLQELAQQSVTNGTYLAFDVVYTGPKFEFRTYTGARGVDHRFPAGQNPILLAPEFGNLGNCRLTQSYVEEKNYIYGLGQDEGVNRKVLTSNDNVRIGLSPFNLNEESVDARNSDLTSEVQAEADAALRAGRPKIIFTGELINTNTTQRGVQYDWGDMLTAQYIGRAIDVRVESVHVTLSEGKETNQTMLQSVI